MQLLYQGKFWIFTFTFFTFVEDYEYITKLND